MCCKTWKVASTYNGTPLFGKPAVGNDGEVAHNSALQFVQQAG